MQSLKMKETLKAGKPLKRNTDAGICYCAGRKEFRLDCDYIKQKWGVTTAAQFIRKTDDIFELLRNYPDIGKIEMGDIRGF